MSDTELASRRCTTCAPGTPPLDEARAAALHGRLDPAWAREGNQRLRRTFRFRDFRDAFGFTARVALLAEAEGHHPDLELGWGRVAVALTTHAAKGLTDNDFILAAKIDRL
ncbi:MAG TPA: 4a-hydroxytetrahydrobiopterin dehydratase [Actinomycetes bacterium]|jgi:4a-hydroxytetrahydrobiopterin dehydratase|nr:4a-hydroxytetrahydrobiopterin dehydratase [Actinomycetes bacterium]